MTLIPAFELAVWNAWLFIVPFRLVNYGLSALLLDRKSNLFLWPSCTRAENALVITLLALLTGSWVYSVFVPVQAGTAWLYAGLPVYLLGTFFVTMAVACFSKTPPDKPNTTGIYRVSRHPYNLGWLLTYLGIGIACASWVFVLLAFVFLVLFNTIATAEERTCIEKYGDAYREYMERTPRWLGLPR